MQNYCYSSVDEKSGVDLTGLNEVLAGLQSFLLALAEDLYLQPCGLLEATHSSQLVAPFASQKLARLHLSELSSTVPSRSRLSSFRLLLPVFKNPCDYTGPLR